MLLALPKVVHYGIRASHRTSCDTLNALPKNTSTLTWVDLQAQVVEQVVAALHRV